jgi:hypothetical protein
LCFSLCFLFCFVGQMDRFDFDAVEQLAAATASLRRFEGKHLWGTRIRLW